MAMKYYMFFVCIIMKCSVVNLEGIEGELLKLGESLNSLKNMIQLTHEKASTASKLLIGDEEDKVDAAFEALPEELFGYMGQFPKELSSPAPSIRRVRKSVPKLGLHSGNLLRVRCINDNGDLLYGAKADYSDLHGQRMVVQKNSSDQKPTQEYSSYLGDNWRFDFSFRFPIAVDYQNGGTVVVQSLTSIMGRFTMQSGAIEIIGPYEELDYVRAINAQSAIVRDENSIIYWVRGNQRVKIPYSNNDTLFDATLDALSNRVMWKGPSRSQKLFIKNFDASQEPIELFIGSHASGDDFNSFFQRGFLLVTSSYSFNKTVKIRCHLEDIRWQPALVVSLAFTQKTEVNPIALNETNSLVLCQCSLDSGKLYPGVMSVKSGAFTSDELQDENIKIDYFLFSPNGRWIVGQCGDGTVLLWEVRGFDLNKQCTLDDRFHLKEFKALYERAKEKNIQYNLTPEQAKQYNELVSRPYCEVPDTWKARLKLPRK